MAEMREQTVLDPDRCGTCFWFDPSYLTEGESLQLDDQGRKRVDPGSLRRTEYYGRCRRYPPSIPIESAGLGSGAYDHADAAIRPYLEVRNADYPIVHPNLDFCAEWTGVS